MRAILGNTIARYLARFDIESMNLGGFSLTGAGEGLFSTPMGDQQGITAEQVLEYCRAGVDRGGGGFDAIYINGAGWNVAPVLSKLEDALKLKVVWGPVAEMWLTYQTLGIAHRLADCGALMRDAIDPVYSG